MLRRGRSHKRGYRRGSWTCLRPLLVPEVRTMPDWRCFFPRAVQRPQQFLVLRLGVRVPAQVDLGPPEEPRRRCLAPAPAPQHRDELPLVSAREGVGRHDVAFVTNPAATPVRPLLESGCADGYHEVVLADGALHERRDLVAGRGVPAVERHVDAVRPQPGGKLLDPLLVRVVVPGV